MPRAALQAGSVAVALLLAGCADLRWHKPGADTAAREADLQECRQTARLEARRMEPPGLEGPLTIRADPHGRPFVAPTSRRDTERFLNEQDITADCMRARGYDLVTERDR